MIADRRSRRLPVIALGVILAATSGTAVAQAQSRGEPGRFDYYVLALSWSPSFCEAASGAARAQQCGARPYSFVVHGLWPQYERGFPEFCRVPAPRLDRRIVSEMLDLMPAPRLVYHEWDAHGTCSGLTERAYFDLVRRARAAVTIPSQYENLQRPLEVRPDELMDAFVTANAGLSHDAIALDCDRTYLREVRICLTRDLAFRSCGRAHRRTCRADSVLMPPVRGR